MVGVKLKKGAGGRNECREGSKLGCVRINVGIGVRQVAEKERIDG